MPTELQTRDETPAALRGTKTEQNLHTALSAEAQAYLRYLWYEKKAKDDGYEAIAKIFESTARNEQEHAELWFRYLGGYSSTERNLHSAAEGEHFEWNTMYEQFASEARAEGFSVIADLFDRVASVEKQHEQNYRTAESDLRDGKTFSQDDAQTRWICLACGYVVTAAEPPAFCPVCTHPQGYFTKQQSGAQN